MLWSSEQGAEILLLWNKIDTPICTQTLIATCLEAAKCALSLSLERITWGKTEGKRLSLWRPLHISIVSAQVSWEAASGCELDEIVVWVSPAAVSLTASQLALSCSFSGRHEFLSREPSCQICLEMSALAIGTWWGLGTQGWSLSGWYETLVRSMRKEIEGWCWQWHYSNLRHVFLGHSAPGESTG